MIIARVRQAPTTLIPHSYQVITNAGVKAHFLSPAKRRKGGHGNNLVMMKYE